MVPDLKTCEICDVSLPLAAFRRDIHSGDGRFHWCRPCERRYLADRGRHFVHGERTIPFKTRRSPYDNMADVLNQIEADPDSAQTIIIAARERYGL